MGKTGTSRGAAMQVCRRRKPPAIACTTHLCAWPHSLDGESLACCSSASISRVNSPRPRSRASESPAHAARSSRKSRRKLTASASAASSHASCSVGELSLRIIAESASTARIAALLVPPAAVASAKSVPRSMSLATARKTKTSEEDALTVLSATGRRAIRRTPSWRSCDVR
eukprot:scaffold367_cov254-Pinguiococcus_pyrenoidosus.AAC.10